VHVCGPVNCKKHAKLKFLGSSYDMHTKPCTILPTFRTTEIRFGIKTRRPRRIKEELTITVVTVLMPTWFKVQTV
jgi:hypothetical protein